MSIRGGDVRCEIDPDLYEKLRQMAAHRNLHAHELAKELLEKAVAGEFHSFSVMLERLASSGILRQTAARGGK